MFILDETQVVGPKIISKHIWVWNVWVRLYVGPTTVLKVGPQLGAQHCQAGSANRRPKRWPVNQEMAH